MLWLWITLGIVWYSLGVIGEWRTVAECIRREMISAYFVMFFFPLFGPLLFIANKTDSGSWLG